MSTNERPVLVIGATGFLGGRVAAALRADGRAVRCLARTPERAAGLAGEGVEVVKGDMLVAAEVSSAVAGASAVIVCVHTLSPQGAAAAGQGFMDVEAAGLRNVEAACTEHAVRRVLYVTSIGVAEDAASSWLRGRWVTEQALLASGLDVTVVRPGMVVGRGGDGFGIVVRGATRRFALAVGSPRLRFRTVAVDDLAQDIVDLVDRPEAVGQAFEVGSDDVLTMRQMMSVAAESLGRRPASTLFVPTALVRLLAPLIERLARVPHGAISGLVGDGPQLDMTGDPSAVRAVLGRADRPYREAIRGQLTDLEPLVTNPDSEPAALWLDSWRGAPHVRAATLPTPTGHEILVRSRAVAVNPIDGLPGFARRVVLPWLRYPAVLGTDVAGDVVEVGPAVTRFQVGDRVLGHAAGAERSRNRAAEGAFQTHVILLERVSARLPAALPYAEAAVLPLAFSTAAAGLFEVDQLARELPSATVAERDEMILVWGGSTSVGTNAIQLARQVGYQVIATASPHNFALLRELGASACFDYRSAEVVSEIVRHLDGRTLAGTIAIGAGSLKQAVRISRATGSSRVASAYPTPETALRRVLARRQGIAVSAIWGGTPVDSVVGPAVYGFLSDALADGRYRAAPPPLVTGDGLASIPAALERLGRGVSAQKVVVTL